MVGVVMGTLEEDQQALVVMEDTMAEMERVVMVKMEAMEQERMS